jgi:hypothetical protein
MFSKVLESDQAFLCSVDQFLEERKEACMPAACYRPETSHPDVTDPVQPNGCRKREPRREISSLHGNWVKAVETRLSSPDEPPSQREVTSILYRQIEYR